MDLNVTMGDNIEPPAPTEQDKASIDNIRNQLKMDVDDIDSDGDEPIKEVIKEVKEEPIVEEDIEVKPIVKDEVIFNGGTEPLKEKEKEEEEELEVKPIIKEKKIKKPVTSKQAAHLKKAREKALATRQAKAKVRNEEKEAKALERKKKRELKEQQLIEKEDVEHEMKIQAQKAKTATPSSMRSLSEAQILDLQEKAISNYEVKRKAAKEVKKKKQHEEAQQAKIYQSINKAVNPDPDDVWAQCFQ
jgi:hypothetical protein